jgi:hypothetical protein
MAAMFMFMLIVVGVHSHDGYIKFHENCSVSICYVNIHDLIGMDSYILHRSVVSKKEVFSFKILAAVLT